MNILIVTETYFPTISGVANSTDSIARYMISEGHTVTIIAPHPVIKGKVELIPGLRVITTPSVKDPIFADKPMSIFPLGFPTIWKTLHTNRFDIIHIQEPGSIGITALIIAKMMHIPTVGAQHTMPQQVATFFGPFFKIGMLVAIGITRAVYNFYDSVMTPTETMVKYLRSEGIHVPVYAISNGIDTNTFFPKPPDKNAKKTYSLPSHKILFAYLGRIDKDKHIDIAIRAMTKTGPNIHLVIAGFGKEQSVLVKLAKQLGVEEKVTFIGKLTEAEMIQVYRSVDCFVIPSPVESQSIVTLQALAIGLPVIAANAGALPELVHDNENGFLIKADDVNGFAQKMDLMAKDEKLRKKFGEESRKISLNHHKPTVLHKLEEIYLGLVKKTG